MLVEELCGLSKNRTLVIHKNSEAGVAAQLNNRAWDQYGLTSGYFCV